MALACITGAAGHHFLFESGPVFPMPDVAMPSNQALLIYSIMGIFVGFLSLGITKIVYWVEDNFEHLPVHWALWPAIGGLAVGVIGYFFPHTLGVGYDNITGILSGSWPLTLVLTLCIFKFLSWAIALGSGTSGGTLAPLMTMGGAAGAVIGIVILKIYPDAGISIPLSALIGMSAMFAGASRAYLTSVVFALEATMQSNALLPLLGACTGAYIVSFFLMENTIMTEKIVRRGLLVPDSFGPDLLQKITVAEVVKGKESLINTETSVADVQAWISSNQRDESQFIVVDDRGEYAGTIRLADIYGVVATNQPIKNILPDKINASVSGQDALSKAIERMSKNGVEVLPVLTHDVVSGVLSYKDIINAYTQNIEKNEYAHVKISLKRRRMKMMVKSRHAN